LNAIAIVR